jgi:hypothetical protein
LHLTTMLQVQMLPLTVMLQEQKLLLTTLLNMQVFVLNEDGKCAWSSLRFCPGLTLEELRKTRRSMNHNNCYIGWILTGDMPDTKSTTALWSFQYESDAVGFPADTLQIQKCIRFNASQVKAKKHAYTQSVHMRSTDYGYDLHKAEEVIGKITKSIQE